MKTLEINDRGIKVLEDGEIINQALFKEYEEIPFEVKELLLIYDAPENIILRISFSLDEEIVFEIKKVIKEVGWTLKESCKVSKKIKMLLILVVILELFFLCIIFFKVSSLEKQVFELRKENVNSRKIISSFDERIKIIPNEENKVNVFQKSDLNNFLVFLSEVSRISGVNYEKIQFLDKKILISGFGRNMSNLSKLKKFISGYEKIKESKFDFIKKEGEELYFLIELDQE
ncbi:MULTISPECIES: hypothetical protein [unclassified Cetobacterium]|uniref:hypothetical protein n=1 Tax=unclassified Cetobacterium TaxID=2630983 RepID=UPI000648A080|nr:MULTISPECIES: hypothetical protein [unclassified Cetobacterium]